MLISLLIRPAIFIIISWNFISLLRTHLDLICVSINSYLLKLLPHLRLHLQEAIHFIVLLPLMPLAGNCVIIKCFPINSLQKTGTHKLMLAISYRHTWDFIWPMFPDSNDDADTCEKQVENFVAKKRYLKSGRSQGGSGPVMWSG